MAMTLEQTTQKSYENSTWQFVDKLLFPRRPCTRYASNWLKLIEIEFFVWFLQAQSQAEVKGADVGAFAQSRISAILFRKDLADIFPVVVPSNRGI